MCAKVIKQYYNLWNVEKTFRISKSDLEIRPIYHQIKKRKRLLYALISTVLCNGTPRTNFPN